MLAAVALLLMLGFWTYRKALSFTPANPDDLILLSQVQRVGNPLHFLVADWGLGNNAYRPLHSICLWLTYHAFGIAAGANQFINLALHLLLGCLLLRVFRRIQRDSVLCLLLSALVVVSLYTCSPAIWISDRPTLFVALCLVLLLDHVFSRTEAEDRLTVSFPYLAALSGAALLSKESGVVILLLIGVVALRGNLPRDVRRKLIVLVCGVGLAYVAVRLEIFGNKAAAYSESGFLFGTLRYADWSQLPKPLRLVALGENVLKNAAAPILPVFSPAGALNLGLPLLLTAPVWCGTLLLCALSAQRKISRPQQCAVAILVLNALVHYALFRFRTQYLSEIAVCLFVAGAYQLSSDFRRRTAAKVLAAVVLMGNLWSVTRSVDDAFVAQDDELNRYRLTRVMSLYAPRISQDIAQQVSEKYAR
ncbi:MAG: hypothetical protein NTV49_02565 [Kiritimatiellaeota bacterium]|nr:hypothetical protein [Kiritimatiellota bacterium]